MRPDVLVVVAMDRGRRSSLIDPNFQAITALPRTRDHVRHWLERVEETKRAFAAASSHGVDHANVTSILDVYGKAKATCQEARIELPRFEQQLRGWLFEPLSPEERAACDEIAANLGRIREAADFMSGKAERLRAAAIVALRRSAP
jgi:hypothetical protein